MCDAEVRIDPSLPAGDAPCPRCGCLIWFEPTEEKEVRQELIQETLVQEAHDAIRAWVHHITELSKGPSPKVAMSRYIRELVEGLVRFLAARGGAIWLPHRDKWKISYHVGLECAAVHRSQLYQPSHARLLEKVRASGCSLAASPRGRSEFAHDEGNPTDCLLLLCPIQHHEETRAAVEVFQRTEAGPQTQLGYLRFLEQICEAAGRGPVFCYERKKAWWRFWG